LTVCRESSTPATAFKQGYLEFAVTPAMNQHAYDEPDFEHARTPDACFAKAEV
jgi:hypothetical protein